MSKIISQSLVSTNRQLEGKRNIFWYLFIATTFFILMSTIILQNKKILYAIHSGFIDNQTARNKTKYFRKLIYSNLFFYFNIYNNF